MPRLFIAVPLPEDVRLAVAGVVTAVRAATESPDRRGPRWVGLDQLHLTLRFLGAIPAARIPDLTEACRLAAAASRAIPATIAGSGAFPSETRPRAIWLGVAAGAAELTALTAELDRRLVAAGWDATDRPFRAHLTLARMDGVPGGPGIVHALGAAVEGRHFDFTADRVVLYQSHLGRGPGRYEVRGEARLGG